MFEVFFKIWYMIAILPFIMFHDKFSEFLKKRNIYHHWDTWHSFVVLGILTLIVLYINGYRW